VIGLNEDFVKPFYENNDMSNIKTAKSNRHQKRSVRGRWCAVIASFFVCAAIVAFAMTGNIAAMPWIVESLFDAQSAAETQSSAESRSGTVVVEKDNDQCELMKFDNDTGHTTDGSGSCKSFVTLDAHGEPVPIGTIRRLDAISKSFSGMGN
jgi:hypothetical protein